MTQNNLCDACEWKQKLSVSIHSTHLDTIWGFDFTQYPDVQSMRENFDQLYSTYRQQHPEAPDQFWNTHNEYGYTYSQWQIYYLSKKYHRYQDLKDPLFNLFYVLSDYPFFIDLLLMGTRDDPNHHTLHHYFFQMECGVTAMQMIMFRYLKNLLSGRPGSLEQKDKNDFSVYDYQQQLYVPKYILNRCRRFTEKYKKCEQEWFQVFPYMKKCVQCGGCIRPYETMLANKNKCLDFLRTNPEWKDKLIEMVNNREDCNQLYAKFAKRQLDLNCVERHDYVVETYHILLGV